MRRFLKIVAFGILGLLLVPFVSFLAYDVFVFQPYTNAIDEIIATADPEDRDPPVFVRKLIYAANSGSSPTWYVSRSLLTRLAPERTTPTLHWHLNTVLWRLLLDAHYTPDQLTSLYATLIYNGEGQGLNSWLFVCTEGQLHNFRHPRLLPSWRTLGRPVDTPSNRSVLPDAETCSSRGYSD